MYISFNAPQRANDAEGKPFSIDANKPPYDKSLGAFVLCVKVQPWQDAIRIHFSPEDLDCLIYEATSARDTYEQERLALLIELQSEMKGTFTNTPVCPAHGPTVLGDDGQYHCDGCEDAFVNSQPIPDGTPLPPATEPGNNAPAPF